MNGNRIMIASAGVIILWMIVALIWFISRPSDDETVTPGEDTHQVEAPGDLAPSDPHPIDEDEEDRPLDRDLPPPTLDQVEQEWFSTTIATVDWDDRASALTSALMVAEQLTVMTPRTMNQNLNAIEPYTTESGRLHFQQAAHFIFLDRPRVNKSTGEIKDVILENDSRTGVRSALVKYDVKIDNDPVMHMYAKMEFLPDKPLVSSIDGDIDY